jgi:hypothetical protein
MVFRPLSLALFAVGALVLVGPPIAAAWRRRAAVLTPVAGGR